MSEKTEAEVTSSQEKQIERVGDLLRKERITRRITIETIAKDLKLNVRYIKALEASGYDELPADPYVRVYLKSLAKYLTLDPDQILKQFYQERGLTNDQTTREATVKVSITSEKEPRNPTLIVTPVLIALLGGFTFLGNKKGWFVTNSPTDAKSIADTSTIIKQPSSENEIADSLIDSLYAKTGVPAESLKTDTLSSFSNKTVPDTLKLALTSSKDSVWVQVFYDEKSWKNFIRKGQTRVFTALDSFNLSVGNNRALKYSLNGKPINIEGTGVATFRVDNKGVESWTITKWKQIFKGRS